MGMHSLALKRDVGMRHQSSLYPLPPFPYTATHQPAQFDPETEAACTCEMLTTLPTNTGCNSMRQEFTLATTLCWPTTFLLRLYKTQMSEITIVR
jgi:hypothetical protein